MGIRATATLDTRAQGQEEADEGRTEGMRAARFRMTANTGSPMKLTGWKYPVVMDLDGVKPASQKLPIRLNHDAGQGVGHTESVVVENGKLIATGIISRSTESARDVRESARQGFPWRASIGANAEQVEFIKSGEKAIVNGQEVVGPLNIARTSTLGEISFVDLGADPHTDAMIAKPGKNGRKIAAQKDGGETETEASPDPVRMSQKGAEDVKASIARMKIERDRQAAIRALTEEYGQWVGVDLDEIGKISAKALEEGWNTTDTELALIRLTRAKPRPAATEQPSSVQVMQAAAFMNMWGQGGDEIIAKDRDYGPEIAQEAWPLRNRGLRGLIYAFFEQLGRKLPHGNNEFYSALIESQRMSIQASAGGFSTINLPGVLGNVANKVLLEAFTRVDATYDRVADQADYSNFYTHSIFRLQATGDFAKIGGDGELKHGTMEQDAFSNKVDTYGLMLTMSRQDIINDDLNAFRSLTAQLARRARIAVEKALYLLVAEASDVFYTVGRGNRLTTTPLDITGLGAAEAAVLGMVDANGDPIYAQPRFLLVPATLKFMAEQIWSSRLVNDFTTGKARPTDNPFMGRFEPIATPFLNASTIPGNSPTTWYLLADPLMLPAFQVAYLDGRRAPTIETADTLFNVLGLQMRAYWDFGLARLDYRGAVKATA